MQYLQLKVVSDERGVLFEKDLATRVALHSLLNSVVSDLVQDGTISIGQTLCAVVVPQYDGEPCTGTIVERRSKRVIAPSASCSFPPDCPVFPDRPVSHLTLELQFVENGITCRTDLPVEQVAGQFVHYDMRAALTGLGLLADGESIRYELYARDDHQSRNGEDRFPVLEERATNMVQILPEQDAAPAFAIRSPASYVGAELVGELDPGDRLIFVRRSAMDRLIREASTPAEVERGGMLVGQIYASADNGRHLVEVSDFIVGEHTESSVVELRYTFETWLSHSALMREKFSDRRIVGWYHTHLVEVDILNDAQKLEKTTLFFSQDDVFLHTEFFGDPWYIALVLDLQGNRMFFQWKDGRICMCKGYYLF